MYPDEDPALTEDFVDIDDPGSSAQRPVGLVGRDTDSPDDLDDLDDGLDGADTDDPSEPPAEPMRDGVLQPLAHAD